MSSWGEAKESARLNTAGESKMVSGTYLLRCARGGAVGNVAVGGSLEVGVELGVGRVHARQETLHRGHRKRGVSRVFFWGFVQNGL